MPDLKIENHTIKNGTLYQVPDGKDITKIIKEKSNDRKDQVFFEANGKNYYIESDNLDISRYKSYNVGMMDATFNFENEKATPVKLIETDNEKTSIGEGVKTFFNDVKETMGALAFVAKNGFYIP